RPLPPENESIRFGGRILGEISQVTAPARGGIVWIEHCVEDRFDVFGGKKLAIVKAYALSQPKNLNQFVSALAVTLGQEGVAPVPRMVLSIDLHQRLINRAY